MNQIVGDEVPNRFNGCNCLSKLRNVDFFVQYLTMMWRGISDRRKVGFHELDADTGINCHVRSHIRASDCAVSR